MQRGEIAIGGEPRGGAWNDRVPLGVVADSEKQRVSSCGNRRAACASNIRLGTMRGSIVANPSIISASTINP